MASSSRRSAASVLPFQRSMSPAGGREGSPGPFLQHHQRSASPTRVRVAGAGAALAPSVRLSSLHRSASPARFLAAAAGDLASPSRRTCLCSPSTHPGSFRCHLHKGLALRHGDGSSAAASPSNRLNARRSAMVNSLVRIGAVEGDWVKRALSALIRPSSHQQRRRTAFQPRPSRLSRMSSDEDA